MIAAAPATSVESSAKSDATDAPRLLIVGDSVVLGATEVVGAKIVASAAAGFVEQLKTLLPGWSIVCDGAVHRTTVGTLEVLPALLTAHRPTAVFFMVGGSDADIDWRRFILRNGASARSNVPIEKFIANLGRIADLCAAAGATPVFMDMPNCDLPARTRWLEAHSGKKLAGIIGAAGGQGECDRRTQMYVRAIQAISAARQIPVAHWAIELQSLPAEQRFGADGFHPSDPAHAIIAAAVARAILQAPNSRVRPAGPSVPGPSLPGPNVAACA